MRAIHFSVIMVACYPPQMKLIIILYSFTRKISIIHYLTLNYMNLTIVSKTKEQIN